MPEETIVKTKVIVNFNDNWADEMDISGIRVYDKAHWEDCLKELESIAYPRSFCVGTNEYIQYDSFEELGTSFKAIDITDEEAEIINRVVTRKGFFPYIHDWLENPEETSTEW